MLKEECIDPKTFDGLVAHEEWWCYDLFATADSLGFAVPSFCIDWTLSHFVLAQHYWLSSEAVMDSPHEKTIMIQAVEERLIRAAFRGRHCWSEQMKDYVNRLIFPHELPK